MANQLRVVVDECSTDAFPNDAQSQSLCKRGQGAECCVWLTVDRRGFVCRFLSRMSLGALQDRFDAGETTAKRDGCVTMREFNPTGLDTEVSIPIKD